MNQKAKSLSAIVLAAKRLRYTTQLARKHSRRPGAARRCRLPFSAADVCRVAGDVCLVELEPFRLLRWLSGKFSAPGLRCAPSLRSKFTGQAPPRETAPAPRQTSPSPRQTSAALNSSRQVAQLRYRRVFSRELRRFARALCRQHDSAE